MKKNYKPFNIEEVKNGAKVITRNGNQARIVCLDYNYYGVQRLLVLVKNKLDEHENVLIYNMDGSYSNDANSLDLFMAPIKREGWVVLYHCTTRTEVSHKGVIFSSKEEIDELYSGNPHVIAAKIEWEE